MDWQIVIGIILGLIAIDLLVTIGYAFIILPIFERIPPFGVHPVDPHPDAEEIFFQNAHGLTLRGSLYQHQKQPSRGLILFCPELAGSHWSVMSYCEGLWNAGFDLIAFDFRNQGESDFQAGYEPLHWLTEFELNDTLSAIDYIKSRDDLRNLPLGVMGISRGGTAAMAVAARCPEIECVACEGSYVTNDLFLHFALRWAALYAPDLMLKLSPMWHLKRTLNLARRISQWKRKCRYVLLEQYVPQLRQKRILLISGKRDSYVNPEVPKKMCERIFPNNEDCLWIVPKAKHNGARKVAKEEYDRRLVEFFAPLSLQSSEQQINQPQPQAGA